MPQACPKRGSTLMGSSFSQSGSSVATRQRILTFGLEFGGPFNC